MNIVNLEKYRKMIIKQIRFSVIVLLAATLAFAGCKKTCAGAINAVTVYAGNDVYITLPTDSAVLTASVKSGSTSNTSFLWSSISGPNAPAIANKASLTATVSNLTTGKYIFQFRATNDQENVGLDTVSVIVQAPNSPAIKTLSATPGLNETFTISGGIPSNGGYNAPELFATAWTQSGNPAYGRPAFKFDLTGIPANATILYAKLTLYSDSTPINGDHLGDANYGNNAFYVQRISSTWDGNTYWDTQPSVDSATEILIPSTILPQLDLVDLDVTNIVMAMDTTNNYGFEIRLQNETIYASRIFCSDYYSESSRWPKLVVTYQ